MKKRIVFLLVVLTLLLAFTSCDLINGQGNSQTTPDTEHEHAFGEWEIKTPASCIEAGEEARVCDCGEAETRAIEATGHNYEAVVTAPTCTEAGYTTYTCSCGDSYVADETAKADHNYEAVVTAPTCTEAGYTTYTCACGDSYVADETAATGHSYDAVVTDPTCNNGGYTTYTCSCGESYVGDETTIIPHNMVEVSDETHHWSACSNKGCEVTTEKVAHIVNKIAVSYFEQDMMENKVLTAADITVTATCTCGSEFVVTEGIEVINGTLALGENTVTVKVGDASMEMLIYARPFSVAVGGNVKEDTYVYSASGSQEKNYASQPELSTNGENFRVLLKYNFNDVINNIYYNDHKDEATIEFVFTITAGSIDESTKLTFKAYPVDAVRSGADFSELTWKNYDSTYGFGWGKADGFINKEAGSPYVTIFDNAIIITLTYREIEQYIDENGDALFVFAIWKSSTKIGSIDNENNDVHPRWTVHFSNEHTHAYIEEVVEDKYLASANCGETAKYYKSCSCGEASNTTFNYGEVIEHSYSEWLQTQAPTCTVEGINSKTCENCGDVQTEAIPVIAHGYNANVTAPTCTEAGYTTYTCSCGDTYTADQVPATGHTYGEWLFDESYHWQACACGDIANKATHEGGEATETEQAICDTCKQPYGGLASHVHNYNASVTAPTCTEAGYTTYTCACGDVYTADEVTATGHTYGEWETVHPATCEGDEVLVHYCACGESETGKGALAFGHDMQTKYDENNHWTECAHNCGKSTDPVAHFGGEATETEKAVCEGCGQPYGELKEAPKQQYIVNGTVLQDNYVNTSSNGTDYSHKKYLGTDANSVRSYLKIDFSDILKAVEEDDIAYSDAKIHIVLTACKNPDKSYVYNKFTSDATITFAGFIPGDTTTGMDISNTENKVFTATNVKASDLYWDKSNTKLVTLLSGKKQSQEPDHIAISEDGLTLTITFTLQELMDQGLIGQDGLGIFTFRCGGMTDKVVVASLEHGSTAGPAVKCEYYK